METAEVTTTGTVHLDGTQATAYARIRSTSGDDFLRASRQRIVLQAMLDKAQNADLASLKSMCTDILKQISTNFTARAYTVCISSKQIRDKIYNRISV